MKQPTKSVPKKDDEELNPEGTVLKNRQTRLNILEKIEEMKRSRQRYLLEIKQKNIEIEQDELERDKLKKPSDLFNLFMASQLFIIDEEKTLMASEPAIKNLFDEDELSEIKSLILKKLRSI